MGHASKQEKQYILKLEQEIDWVQSPLEKLIELGSLYIEPSHDEKKAIEVFKRVLLRDPDQVVAKIWIAYCHIHYTMDSASLNEAKNILESITLNEDIHSKAAAYMLQSEVLSDLGESSAYKEKELLEYSVALEPNWVNNRYILAWTYKELGQGAEAVRQMREAIQNIRSSDPLWNKSRVIYERCITGRLGNINFYKDEYNRMMQEV